MFLDLGEMETEVLSGCLSIIKCMKINKLNGVNYSDTYIDKNIFDMDFLSYNNCYLELNNSIYELLITPISDNIQMESEIDSDCQKKILELTDVDSIERCDIDFETLLSIITILTIEFKSGTNCLSIMEDLKQLSYVSGQLEDYITTSVFNEGHIVKIIIDTDCVNYGLLDEEFISLLWKYKKEGILI